ncbi:MAG: hypothetical protein NZO16_03090, partial [Deltaproteobacteria bacterium]|nr:hypothetical protein [Deltaproteobacteria bacterium]
MGRVVFVIQKSFGKLCLSDENGSLAIEFIPCLEGQPLDKNHPQYCKVHIDKSALGELLVTAKCFLHGYETGDFTFTKKEGSEDEIVVRLYKDRHKSGDECWLR